MPSINMIALRREEKRRQEQNARKLLYAIAGEVGLVVVVACVLTARIVVTQDHIGDLWERSLPSSSRKSPKSRRCKPKPRRIAAESRTRLTARRPTRCSGTATFTPSPTACRQKLG